MKKKLITLVGIILSAFFSNAQMTLDHTYPDGSSSGTWANNGPLQVIDLLLSGKKFAQNDMLNSKVYIYNMDHSLWKTINLPTVTNCFPQNAYYISENLFKIDGYVDLTVCYYDTIANTFKQVIIDETGAIINTLSNCMGINLYNIGIDSFKVVATKPLGYVNHRNRFGFDVYSVPGTIPCAGCSNGSVVLEHMPVNNENAGFLSEPLPNPANGQVRIDYVLPLGSNVGDIIFRDVNGKQVKKYAVYNTSTHILIENLQLPSGNYYFSLISNGAVVGSKKIIITK